MAVTVDWQSIRLGSHRRHRPRRRARVDTDAGEHRPDARHDAAGRHGQRDVLGFDRRAPPRRGGPSPPGLRPATPCDQLSQPARPAATARRRARQRTGPRCRWVGQAHRPASDVWDNVGNETQGSDRGSIGTGRAGRDAPLRLAARLGRVGGVAPPAGSTTIRRNGSAWIWATNRLAARHFRGWPT